MKRLLIALVLIGVLYILGQMVVSGIKTYTQGASLVLSGLSAKDIQSTVREYYNKKVLSDGKILSDDTDIQITPAYVNNDRELDIIARIESTDTCGGGGCLTTLFIQNEGTLEPVSFTYAVKEIQVLESITNQMHDIRINNDKDKVFVWSGEQYLPIEK